MRQRGGRRESLQDNPYFCKETSVCTLALYFRVFEEFPLIVAANRDEYFSRPSVPPMVLATAPLIVGGRDLVAGGTWLGINERGLLAAILNRKSGGGERAANSLRSRGLLCLDLLALPDSARGRNFLEAQNGATYRPFNLLVADENSALVASNVGAEIRWIPLAPGLHVLGNTSVYDPSSEKMNRAYVLFAKLTDRLAQSPPNPALWISSIGEILRDHAQEKDSKEPKNTICVHADGYGTVSSTIVWYSRPDRRFHIYHSPGPPCRSSFIESRSVDIR